MYSNLGFNVLKIQNFDFSEKRPQRLRQLQQRQLESCERVHEDSDQIYAQQWRYPEQQPRPTLKQKQRKRLSYDKHARRWVNISEVPVRLNLIKTLHVNFHDVANMKARPINAVDRFLRASERFVVAAFLMIWVSSDSLLRSSPVRVTSQNAISCKFISLC